MKPEPTPKVLGNTEAERMSNALRMVLTVPKEAILKAEAKLKEAREKAKEERLNPQQLCSSPGLLRF
jgi:hypothetical protein